MVQRGHHFAIVDEVDSILIDEARTPLIISGPSNESARLYYQFAGVARSLSREADYEVDEEKRTVAPTEEGSRRSRSLLGIDNLYDLGTANLVHQLTKALQAKELYKRDKDYLVADGEVKIVDEFTGRILEGRRWSDGLHQAVEAKERVAIKEENHTWATVTLQNYFRLYDKLSGMTGRPSPKRPSSARRTNPGRAHPDQFAHGPPGLPGPHLPDRKGQVQCRGRRRARALRKGPARLGGHGLGGEVRGAIPDVHQARYPPRGPQRQAARPGGGDHRPGGPAQRHNGGHQHGRAWCRHPPRRQPRRPGPGGCGPRASTPSAKRASPARTNCWPSTGRMFRRRRPGARARRAVRARLRAS